MLGHILFDVLVLDRAFPVVDFLDLGRDDIHSGHVVVLGEQDCEGKTDIARSGNGDLLPSNLWYFRLVIHNDIRGLEAQGSGQGKKLIHRRAVVAGLQSG